MESSFKRRRLITVFIILAGLITSIIAQSNFYSPPVVKAPASSQIKPTDGAAVTALEKLAVKGRAPKTNYSRVQFGNGWKIQGGCDTREIILNRDLTNKSVNTACQVVSGILNDPYTGKIIEFRRGASSSNLVQIDHIVALSNAWQTGAQSLTLIKREELANDPLELLAVDGAANQQKSDGDAATWLPPNKPFRCQYVARQVAVKAKYNLWVTAAEKDAMKRVLSTCPGQALPSA